MRLEPNWYPW